MWFVNPGLSRFSGFAELYDAHRPCPPRHLGPLLASYAGTDDLTVADLGSGTGLSTRWAKTWASSVIGIEPNPDMRAIAESRPLEGVEYRHGTSSRSGLTAASVDVVLVVQAMHWMEPHATFAEVARILRPGGVLAVVDADWPPTCGLVGAEASWAEVHRRIRVLEARLARGEEAAALHRPVRSRDADLTHDDPADLHRSSKMVNGVRSWAKVQHLDRMRASGYFTFTREVLLDEQVPGGAERFIALLRSQGSYQTLIRAGLNDDQIGVTDFERDVRADFIHAAHTPQLVFSWRIRIGITPSL